MTKRTRPPTINELATHARELAAAFNVRLMEIPGMPPEFALSINIGLKHKAVLVAPMTDETGYAITLHELGHCCHPSGNLQEFALQDIETIIKKLKRGILPERNMRVALDEETAAWEWAEYYALDWTVAMEHVKAYSVSTYTKGEGNGINRRT